MVDHLWEGFCTSSGELVNIDKQDTGRKEIPLLKGDYGSISKDDIRIMVKIAPEAKSLKKVKKKTKSKAVPVWRHFFSTPQERVHVLSAAMVTVLILGSAYAGLWSRSVKKPSTLSDLSEEYVLAFIGEDHLKTAPEVLQLALDRTQFLGSVFNYYQAYAHLLMGWRPHNIDLILPSSVDLYTSIHNAQKADIDDLIANQQDIDRRQRIMGGASVLYVPAVLGESNIGKTLRINDKVDLLHKSARLNLSMKRRIIDKEDKDSFVRDDIYDYKNYRNPNSENLAIKAYLSRVAVWDRSKNEKQMYTVAAQLGRRAKNKQQQIEQNRAIAQEINDLETRPIGLPHGTKFVSFTNDIDLMEADSKLLILQASQFGTSRKRPKVREPLVGEIDPSLIERHIRSNQFQLKLCYDLALRRNEGTSGTMEWSWRIDSRGKILDLSLVSSTISDKRMVNCIRRKIVTWRFPRPRRGSVSVQYPFEFHPTKG